MGEMIPILRVVVPRIERPIPPQDEPIGYDDYGEPIWASPRAEGNAIPPNCLRVFNSPLPADRGGSCDEQCPGRQRDGGCFLDVLKAFRTLGLEPKWEIDPRTGYWDPVVDED